MNAQTKIEPISLACPSAAGEIPYNPARPERAFRQVADMETDFNRLRGLMRLLLVMDLDDVCSDERDALAILELTYTANETIDRLYEKRNAAWSELHPFAYPRSHGWEK